MPILSSAPRTTGTLSPPLPAVNEYLSRSGVALRRSQFSLWAAAPGVGKTITANNLALFMKVPTLYFSADSDEWTVRQRACSILTMRELAQVEKDLLSGDWPYDRWLAKADHIDWCYATDIDPEFIGLRIKAYAEPRGVYPHLIVVDNLGNTVENQGDEYAELRAVCRDLQRVARLTKAHVMGLHHVVGPKESGTQPIDQGDLLGKLAKIPEQVFGLHMEHDKLVVNVAKNRGGKRGFQIHIPIDYSRALLAGFRYD